MITDEDKRKTAIVTGASRGIGLAIAQRLTRMGARVCLTARSPEPLEKALATLSRRDSIAVAGRADDIDHRREVLNQVAEQFGRLDILVNNAGINPAYGPLMELDLDSARKIFEVNVLAMLGWIQDAYHHPHLGFAESGSVINISSVTGQTPFPGIGFYGTSKAAVDHLTRTLAVELGPKIRVNAVAPAIITTQFSHSLYAGKEEEVSSAYPMKRLGTPEDVADAVDFLIGAEWVTGQVINIDGGLTANGGAS